jgi:hypothetical protein
MPRDSITTRVDEPVDTLEIDCASGYPIQGSIIAPGQLDRR